MKLTAILSASIKAYLGGKDEEEGKKEALFVTHLYSVLVPARTGLVFAVVRRGHVQDTEVILHHLAFAKAGGKGVSFGDKGSQHSAAGPAGKQKEWLDMVNCQGVFPWELLISCTLYHHNCCC